MMEINLFWKTLRQFFTVYLPKQRNCSTNTIEACHKTWNMLDQFFLSRYSQPKPMLVFFLTDMSFC